MWLSKSPIIPTMRVETNAVKKRSRTLPLVDGAISGWHPFVSRTTPSDAAVRHPFDDNHVLSHDVEHLLFRGMFRAPGAEILRHDISSYSSEDHPLLISIPFCSLCVCCCGESFIMTMARWLDPFCRILLRTNVLTASLRSSGLIHLHLPGTAISIFVC